MRALLLPGQRELHFKHEGEPLRKKITDVIVEMDVEIHIYRKVCVRRSDSVAARQACLMRVTADLVELRTRRWVLDSRESQDADDRRIIRTSLGAQPSESELVYEHMKSTSEPLLWIADAVAWCYGAGGEWQRRIAPTVSRVIHV